MRHGIRRWGGILVALLGLILAIPAQALAGHVSVGVFVGSGFHPGFKGHGLVGHPGFRHRGFAGHPGFRHHGFVGHPGFGHFKPHHFGHPGFKHQGFVGHGFGHHVVVPPPVVVNPYPSYTWVPGGWHWTGSTWAWIPGYWR